MDYEQGMILNECLQRLSELDRKVSWIMDAIKKKQKGKKVEKEIEEEPEVEVQEEEVL